MSSNGVCNISALFQETMWLDAGRLQDAEARYEEYLADVIRAGPGEPGNVKKNTPHLLQNHPFYKKEATTVVLNDVPLIQSWIKAIRYPQNSKMEYFTLVRETLLLMLTPKWKESKQEDVLFAYKSYVRKFSTITPNCTDVYHAVLKIADRPWHNPYTSWDGIFKGTVAVDDIGVCNYFASEPEEVVLARVHSLVLQKHMNPAYGLAKMSILYNSRIAGHLNPHQRSDSMEEETTKVGYASIDWISFFMQNTMSFDEISAELRQFNCHEGMEMIRRLERDPNNKKFCFMVSQVVLLEDMARPSQHCCTQKLKKRMEDMRAFLNMPKPEESEPPIKRFRG